MADVPRVPLGHPPARSWLPRVVLPFAALLVLMIAKPWASPSTAVAPTAGPTLGGAPPATERPLSRSYDPRLFGAREPDPAWELWPAGYVVQFGVAGPVKVKGQDDASPTPVESGPAAVPSPDVPPPYPTNPPLPPGVVDLGPADHLVALGINSPLEARIVQVDLRIYRGADCCIEPVPTVRLPTLWESAHFRVIAPEDPAAPGQPGAWDYGQYVLYLLTVSGEVREVLFVVRPPLG